MNKDFASTLFVGIDVSSKSNYVCAVDYFGNKLISFSTSNNHPGSVYLSSCLLQCLKDNNLSHIVIAMESTSFYSFHLCNFLSADENLVWFKPKVYCLNPKIINAFKNTFVDSDKTDPHDAYTIADFARVGKIKAAPWNGAQYIALQRLTRMRLHLIESINREKLYMLSNIFLKFSELAVLGKDEHPFSNTFGATSTAVLTDFMSPEDIANAPLEELVNFVVEKGKNRFSDPNATAKLLQKAARDSYRLDKTLYDPLNVSIASSLNCIKTFEKEVKNIDKAILKAVKALDNHQYECLNSIKGIGPVFAAGIIAEMGDVSKFNGQAALAKYAGLTWRKKQSGNFEAQDTYMTKTGNKYLRYYLIEAAGSIIRYNEEYRCFYDKKYKEALKHQHKRALALTARKLVRLVYALLRNNQLYSSSKGADASKIS
jgi:transposase